MTTRPPDFNFVEPSAEPLLTFNTLAELAAFQPYDSALHEGRLVLVKGSASAWDELNGGFYRLSRAGASSAAGAVLLADGRAQAIPTTLGRIGQRQERNRYAAKSLGGSSGAGRFAYYSWRPAGENFTLRFTAASRVTPAAACDILGASIAGHPTIRIQTDGAVRLAAGAGGITTSPTGVYAFDGLAHTVEAVFGQTSATIRVDGVTVHTGTYADPAWENSSTTTHSIGAWGGGQRWPGAIWNVECVDHTTPANGFTFLMDEPPTSSTFANSLSGSTAPATATKDTGAAFPWVTSVASTDGRGMPAQPVGPLVYSNTNNVDAAGITGVTTYTPAASSGEADPTGSLALAVFTAPCAGVAHAVFTASMRATTLAGTDGIAAQILSSTAANTIAAATLTAANVGTPFAVNHVESMGAGATLTGLFISLLAGDVYTLQSGWRFTVTFYPTPTTG